MTNGSETDRGRGSLSGKLFEGNLTLPLHEIHGRRTPNYAVVAGARKAYNKPAEMKLIVEKIVSGGQTGVDRAALDVALALGIPCEG